MKRIIKYILKIFGLKINRIRKDVYPIDINNNFIEEYKMIEAYTATSIERVYALKSAITYIIKNKIKGDFVECGVWKGGSCMLMAKTLVNEGEKERKIWMYDTFDGMTEPTDDDCEIETNVSGSDLLKNTPKNTDKFNMWAYAPLEMVKKNMKKTMFPEECIHFIEGKVENTLSKIKPQNIALLRLDTDWYESTKCELEQLYPLLSIGGVLIVDDYGHFSGAKKAVDEYFSKTNVKPLMNRIDYSGRLIIKQ